MSRAGPRPHSLSPRALAIAGWAGFLLAGAIFYTLAWKVASQSPLVALDAQVSTWLHTHRRDWLTTAMLVITHANSTVAMSVWSLAFAGVLAKMRERYWILTLALVMVGGMTLNVILKHAYERARPHFDDPVLTLESYSFPSGHTAGATLFYGVLAAFLVSRYFSHARRAAIVAVAILAIATVAFSRMYLGAHYLSDVAAAASASTAWLALCLSTVHGVVRRRIRAGAMP